MHDSEWLAKRYRLSDDAVFQEVCGELVILELNSERYYGLNDVGTLAWSCLAEGKSVSEVIEAITAEYEVEYEHARADLEELLTQLSDAGLAVEDLP